MEFSLLIRAAAASACRAQLLPSELRLFRRQCHSWASVDVNKRVATAEEEEEEEEIPLKDEGPWWVPHPLTGIYHPEGHAHVLNDVSPASASASANSDSYSHSHYLLCWSRSQEDVQRPPPDPHNQ